jgi:hypothetical protein
MITPETARAYWEQIRELIEAAAMTTVAKGDEFERRFAGYCESRGHVVVKQGRGHGVFDYLVDGLRVQCKSLTPSTDGRVSLHNAVGELGRCYPAGSVDVFAIETDGVLCIVPADDLPSSSKYPGGIVTRIDPRILLPYRDAWWVLQRGERPAGFVRQLPLWSTDEEATYGR